MIITEDQSCDFHIFKPNRLGVPTSKKPRMKTGFLDEAIKKDLAGGASI